MRAYPRGDRVGTQIQKVLSELLHKKIKDPRLEMTVITAVKVPRDMKAAYVYFTTTGGEVAQKGAAKGFQDAQGYIRSALAKVLGLRHMPEIHFVYDESIAYGAHIEDLIRSTHVEDETDHHAPEE